jgi:hypothetical protein
MKSLVSHDGKDDFTTLSVSHRANYRESVSYMFVVCAAVSVHTNINMLMSLRLLTDTRGIHSAARPHALTANRNTADVTATAYRRFGVSQCSVGGTLYSSWRHPLLQLGNRRFILPHRLDKVVEVASNRHLQ